MVIDRSMTGRVMQTLVVHGETRRVLATVGVQSYEQLLCKHLVVVCYNKVRWVALLFQCMSLKYLHRGALSARGPFRLPARLDDVSRAPQRGW